MNKLILPDNNVFSEVIRLEPNKKVVQNYYQNFHHFGMAITVWHELLYGLYGMKDGVRKQNIAKFIHDDLALLPKYHYTQECADIHAKIRAECRAKGKTLSFADSQIASIALVNNAILVTRNVDDFKAIDGLMIENWFDN
ncbi:Probable ribonuclease FitB [Moraxella lacunata]|uniref:Probable ribonuclease FitB n=1 Tax=Moraxella lacunata TaxID=477 RepID=A0A378T6W0_MORLA|nr:type II toxin-antitoxin system VapC family toxin [Moraxella lacunata]STZ56360.1 Probable ribonuclease FitB [Moraxella lacunata]